MCLVLAPVLDHDTSHHHAKFTYTCRDTESQSVATGADTTFTVEAIQEMAFSSSGRKMA